MVFKWMWHKSPKIEDHFIVVEKRMNTALTDIDFLKISLKNIQSQIDNLDIRMLEVKKDYHKKLKQAVEAIKEEEEAEQEEEEKPM